MLVRSCPMQAGMGGGTSWGLGQLEASGLTRAVLLPALLLACAVDERKLALVDSESSLRPGANAPGMTAENTGGTAAMPGPGAVGATSSSETPSGPVAVSPTNSDSSAAPAAGGRGIDAPDAGAPEAANPEVVDPNAAVLTVTSLE